jgi:hypothetical protein
MDFLPKNKWMQLLVFALVVMVAVVAALSITKVVPDTKNVGGYRLSAINLKKKKTA